jgi:hypothetical protein
MTPENAHQDGGGLSSHGQPSTACFENAGYAVGPPNLNGCQEHEVAGCSNLSLTNELEPGSPEQATLPYDEIVQWRLRHRRVQGARDRLRNRPRREVKAATRASNVVMESPANFVLRFSTKMVTMYRKP